MGVGENYRRDPLPCNSRAILSPLSLWQTSFRAPLFHGGVPAAIFTLRKNPMQLLALLYLAAVSAVPAATAGPLTTASIQVSGVFPSIVGTAESAPLRSECGVGAIMAWADALYYITYLSVPNAGNGTGLYKVSQDMTQTVVAEHSSVFANRMIIPGMQSIVIGPYVIDALGNIRVIQDLLNVRIGGMAEHLTKPETMAYFLGMDGPLWEVDLVTLTATKLFDMITALDMCNYPTLCPEQPHFKAAHSMAGKLWVATNTYEQEDALSIQHGGRLASWDGVSANWTIVERTAFVEVTGRHNMGQVLFAVGWDDASVILKVQEQGGDETAYGGMNTYRLPKASHAYDHLWTTEVSGLPSKLPPPYSFLSPPLTCLNIRV